MCCFVRIVSGEIVLNRIGRQSLWCRREVTDNGNAVEKPRKGMKSKERITPIDTRKGVKKRRDVMSRFQPRCNQRV